MKLWIITILLFIPVVFVLIWISLSIIGKIISLPVPYFDN